MRAERAKIVKANFQHNREGYGCDKIYKVGRQLYNYDNKKIYEIWFYKGENGNESYAEITLEDGTKIIQFNLNQVVLESSGNEVRM